MEMGAKKNNRHQAAHITLSGIIERIPYDDDVPYQAAIYTDDGEEFFVESTHKKARLRKLHNSYVEITGSLRKVDGHNVVTARRIVEIDPVGYIHAHEDRIADMEEFSDVEGFSHLAEYGHGYDYSEDL